MKLPRRSSLIALLMLAGAIGSILGTREFKDAVVECQDLYRVDTTGSQIETGLEYEIQESRRTFSYALSTRDPNEQLPYIDQTRAASARVQDYLSRLRALPAPQITTYLNRFQLAWNGYEKVRNEVIALVLEGDLKTAMQVEQDRAQPALSVALQSLLDLQAALGDHARIQSARVTGTLRRSAAGLGAFAVSTLLIVAVLGRVSRDRRLALESLNASSAALAAAREMELRRVSILEMVSTHAPLPQTLEEIAGVATQHAKYAGAAIWAAEGRCLKFQVAANLCKELKKCISELSLSIVDVQSENLTELEEHLRRLAGQFSLVAGGSRALHDRGGLLIGFLQVFVPVGGGGLQRDVLKQMAHLAATAIENRLLYERLAFQAQHDALTDLPNRTLFQDRVQQALNLSRRHRKRAAVLWVDLDRFKQINDNLGHRVGDEVLCEVGRRLKRCLRDSDTVARVGGDEFTILAHDLDSPADAEVVGRKVLAELSRPMQLGEHNLALTASTGISLFPDHGEEPIALMRHADLAMYSAKRDGGHSARLFRPILGETMLRRVRIERELKTALERDELCLHYQPLVDSEGGLNGLEALVRWNNAALGSVSPAEFIPIAEDMGLIQVIGEWVLRSACSQGARWLAAGLKAPGIAVNVSAAQFMGRNFTAVTERALEENDFPPNMLVIEITETVFMNNLDTALEQMAALRRRGVRFAIDDFGTGYSSLSQLRNLPVDCIKIDRSFVKDLEIEGGGSSTLVRGIVALAHSLSLEVVAEGVETEGQLSLLREMGCDTCQGFYLYRPMPAPEVEKLLTPGRAEPEGGEVPDLAPVIA